MDHQGYHSNTDHIILMELRQCGKDELGNKKEHVLLDREEGAVYKRH